MKKKKYITPMCEVMDIKVKSSLLAGSQFDGEFGKPGTGFGETPTPDTGEGEEGGDIWEMD